jgi:hypothetical protein
LKVERSILVEFWGARAGEENSLKNKARERK